MPLEKDRASLNGEIRPGRGTDIPMAAWPPDEDPFGKQVGVSNFGSAAGTEDRGYELEAAWIS